MKHLRADEVRGSLVIQFRAACLKTLKIKVYRTIIWSVVLYGCETWSLTLREEHRLRVSENRIIFVPMRVELRGGWGKLRIETFHMFCFSPNII
jgi:hypothetical protein